MTLDGVRAGMPEYDVTHKDHLFMAKAAEHRQQLGMPPIMLAVTIEDLLAQYRAAREHAGVYVKHASECRSMFEDHRTLARDILAGASA